MSSPCLKRQPPLAMGLLLSAATFALAALVTSQRPVVPQIHDEFSYLLAADTFAHGRLANPAPACWPSFESFHIIVQPTYASKYPPLQGAMLAIGQSLAGDPAVGLWITSALATAAAYWMLLGWLPRRFADVIALLLVLHPGIQLAWGQSYWGGTAAFAAGALVWGAVPRLRKRLTFGASIAMAVGAGLLANCRPYEGLVAVLAAGSIVVVHWLRNSRPALAQVALRIVIPQAAVLIPIALLMAAYNHAVTGSWTTLPYQVHEATYAQSPNFAWQPLLPDKMYRHAVIEGFHRGWALDCYRQLGTWHEYLAAKWRAMVVAGGFLLTWPLAVLCLAGLTAGRRSLRITLLLSIGWLASMVTVWSFPHYMAPTAPLLLVLAGEGLRRVRMLAGQRSRVVIAIVIVAQAVAFLGAAVSHVETPSSTWAQARQTISDQFSGTGKQHLVLVRYAVEHDPLHEWVYNGADLESAPVVWAREADPASNAKLLTHYAGRMIWLLEPDAQPPKLLRYGATKLPAGE